ncbi:MAG: dihydrofolate reductase [Treponema sp.]|jgi:dihydrofolate reductase|nr:dihydrofolate reductase [Treponema sp.]
MDTPEIIIIAAMAENRVIGKGGALPWSLREDMARFKKLTMGHPCIMGRKTWESLPKKPLPGRLNIVISSRGPAALAGGAGESAGGRAEEPAVGAAEGPRVFASLKEAIRYCGNRRKVFICGGASIYREAVAVADALELTLLRGAYEGDVFFPEIDPGLWHKVSSEDHETYSFIRYNKIKGE